jgi:hypothetical protein
MERGVIGTGGQHLGEQDTSGGLDGGGPAERPALPGRPGRARSWFRRAAACYLGPQRGPAPVAVFAGDSQLGRRERDPSGHRAKPAQSTGLAIGRGAKQLPRLTAKLVNIGPGGKLGHDVSSRPGLAFGRDTKTILPKSTTLS